MMSKKPPSPMVERASGRMRSPSPRTLAAKRAPAPHVDSSTEADMLRVKKVVAKVLRARLYLLQQPGPNSFMIGGDSPEHKFKVIIGPQSCTCGKEPFCVHVLFVMLRVFQVKENDAVLWRRELKNYEVEGLFKKYHQRVALLSKHNVSDAGRGKTDVTDKGLTNPFSLTGPVAASAKDDEEVCPICLLEMIDGESMTMCREGCHNRLHHHCMAVWAEECRRRNEQLNCPLCRTPWLAKRPISPLTGPELFVSSSAAVPSLNYKGDVLGLPRGELIPPEFKELSKNWVKVFGSDVVACLFSRDWKHRESGLRYMSRKTVKLVNEWKAQAAKFETKCEVLQVCSSILAHILSDPVYNVYVASLRAFRAILSTIKFETREEVYKFHEMIKPVVERVLLKCADGNRRVTIISIKVLMELALSDFCTGGDLSHRDLNVQLFLSCISASEASSAPKSSQSQWWLGRLLLLQKLLMEQSALLLQTSVDNISTVSLPVSPSLDADLDEFMNSVHEGSTSALRLESVASARLKQIVQFAIAAISYRHQNVTKCALHLLVKCIAVASLDKVLFGEVKRLVLVLKPHIQSTLQRHLSCEAQREQADILNILEDYGESLANRSFVDDNEDVDDGNDVSVASASALLTPPQSPSLEPQKRLSLPYSAYDPNLKGLRQEKDDEAQALAAALEKSRMRPENVVPEQLKPLDDITLIHVQAGESRCDPKNVYIEGIHWRKGGLLGTGAFSTCYEAMDLASGRLMAVKQISFCRNSESEQTKVHEAVLEEITLLHRLQHPNIVSCLGATQHEGHYNLFLECMSGGSVSRLLARFGPFRRNVVLNYTRQLISAVAYVHSCNMIHRDIKGANLLVDSTGQVLKLSDFGTAARLKSSCGTEAKEFSGQLLGTIPFMSPEVLRGEHYGRKTDVWSIGCCIIEMATGRPPWGDDHHDNALALMFKIASATCSPDVPSDLSPELRDVTLRCLELQEANRPTAAELLRHPAFRM